MNDFQPQQQVLIDDTVIVTFVDEAPNDPTLAIVESRGVGPMVIEKSRLKVVV